MDAPPLAPPAARACELTYDHFTGSAASDAPQAAPYTVAVRWLRERLSWRVEVVTAVDAGGTRVLPLVRVLRLGAPGGGAALVWSRPLAIVADGRRLPVRDVTRRWQLALLVAGLLASLAVGRLRHGREATRRGGDDG